MKRHVGLFVAVAATGMSMAVPVSAQRSGGLVIEHPALHPFTMAGAQPEGVTEQTATRASVASAVVGVERGMWHHPLYPFLVAGARGEVAQVATQAPAAAVGSEAAVWHPALFPFSIAGR